MEATLTHCDACGHMAVSLAVAATRSKPIPGTGRLDCLHTARLAGTVHVAGLVHVALSSVIRSEHAEQSARDTAHVIQEWLRVPDSMRRASWLPYPLISGYDVSSEGLATARILARAMASVTAPGDAYYWSAAASVLRRRLG